MATTPPISIPSRPLSIPGRLSPGGSAVASPLRHSGSPTSGHVGTPPTLHAGFWSQHALKPTGHFKNTLLSASARDEKLCPSDYFYSFLPVLANLSPEHGSNLRPKVHSSQKLDKAERSEILTQRVKKEFVELSSCQTERAKYIKYKIDKLILLDDIAASLPVQKKNFIKTKIIDLVVSLRLDRSLLNKNLNGIDDFSLSSMLDKIPDYTKDYIGGGSDKRNAVLCQLIKNNPEQFNNCLAFVYANKYNNGDKAKMDERRNVEKLVDRYIAKPESFNDVMNEILTKYDHVFDAFDSKEALETLPKFNMTVFSLLTPQKKQEEFDRAKVFLAKEIAKNEAAMEALFTTYFSKFTREEIAELKQSATNDIQLTNPSYQFRYQSINDLHQDAKTRLNGIAVKKKQDLPTVDLGFDLFGDTVPAANGPVEINATDAFKTACQQRMDEIAKKWNSNSSLIVNLLYHNIQSESTRTIPQLESLLKPNSNPDFADFDSAIIEEILRLIKFNPSDFFFNGVEKYFVDNDEHIQQDAGHANLSNDTSVKMIKALVKEQKKHVFERFTNLNPIFEGFVRDANYIIEKAESLKKGSGEDVRAIICSILEDSHTDVKSQTVCDNHHAKHIMGNRQKQKSEYYQGVKEASSNLFDLLLLPDDHFYRRANAGNGFDHAHTFPFPAVMNWKAAKLKELISAKSYQVHDVPDLDDQLRESKAPILKHGFNSLKDEIKGQKNGSFQQQIDKLLKSCETDSGKFLFISLNLLSTVYLYLLSETEFLPALINKDVDQISEWKLEQGHNYKTHFKDSLLAMVKVIPPNGTRKKMSENFAEYIPYTLEVADKKEETWRNNASQGIDNAIVYKLLQIFSLQMRQAVVEAETVTT